jgi:hypothetical protein
MTSITTRPFELTNEVALDDVQLASVNTVFKRKSHGDG